MDITELKNHTIIEIVDRVSKPRASERSKKPIEYWEPGQRFRVRSWKDRHADETDGLNWELTAISHRGTSGRDINLNGDPQRFLRILSSARVVNDVRAALSARSYGPDAEDVLDWMERHKFIDVDLVKQAIAAIELEVVERDKAKVAAELAEEAEAAEVAEVEQLIKEAEATERSGT